MMINFLGVPHFGGVELIEAVLEHQLLAGLKVNIDILEKVAEL
jgi:hypothetical protein